MKARVLFPLVVTTALGLGFSASAHTTLVIHAAQIDMPDNSLVALTGTVIAKGTNTVVVEYAGGDVRVHVPNTVQWYESFKKHAIDAMDVGQPVTIYGKIESGRRMPKIEAQAVYVPQYDRLFFADAQKALVPGEHVHDRLQEEYTAIN